MGTLNIALNEPIQYIDSSKITLGSRIIPAVIVVLLLLINQ